MMKSNLKLGLTASAIAASARILAGCGSDTAVVSKPSIDGGGYYPVTNGKTSTYAIDSKKINIYAISIK